MTIYWPSSLMIDLFEKRLGVGDSYRAILLGPTYEFVHSHAKRSALTAFEIAATGGYATGGVATTLSHAVDANGLYVLNLGGVSLGTGPVTARWVAYVRWRGGAASADEVVALLDLGRAVKTDGPFVVPAQAIQNPR